MHSQIFEQSLQQISLAIENAARMAHRNPADITLIAASKTVTPDILRTAHQLGILHFGENRVQELKAKAPMLPSTLRWHFIGSLQTNKVRDVVHTCELIHSADRLALLEEIEKKAAQKGKQQKLLIEVNISGEASKHGAPPHEVEHLLNQCAQFPHLEPVGFMTVAPFREDPEQTRPTFAALRQLRDDMETRLGCPFPELSMGMSHDYPQAIAEGATMVRIGSALFGNRPRPQA